MPLRRRCVHLYVAALGLTNAQVFFYRRLSPEVPRRAPLELRCGVTAHERLLLPNHGLDACAWYSYLLEHYNALPSKGAILLHGHGAAWHVTCEAIASRARLWYQHAAMDDDAMQHEPVTLTSKPAPHEDYMAGFGGRRELLGRVAEGVMNEGNKAADAILQRWGVNRSA